MKKIILAAIVLLSFASAQATTLSAEVGSSFNQNTKQFNRTSEFRVQNDAIGIQLVKNGSVDRVEADYNLRTSYIPFASVDIGAGVVTGQTIGHYTYSVMPKVQFDLSDKVSLVGSYKFRSDADKTVQDRTQTASIGIGYEAYKDVALIAKISSMNGDVRSKTASVGVAYRF